MLGADVVAGDDWPRERRTVRVIKPITWHEINEVVQSSPNRLPLVEVAELPKVRMASH